MPRTSRRAQNQALFREVNDHIADVAAHMDEHAGLPPGPTYSFVCECGKTGCRAPVIASVPTYVSIRADASAFLVTPGHERPAEEEVVWSTDDLVVVRPRGRSARASTRLRLIGTPQL